MRLVCAVQRIIELAKHDLHRSKVAQGVYQAVPVIPEALQSPSQTRCKVYRCNGNKVCAHIAAIVCR